MKVLVLGLRAIHGGMPLAIFDAKFIQNDSECILIGMCHALAIRRALLAYIRIGMAPEET